MNGSRRSSAATILARVANRTLAVYGAPSRARAHFLLGRRLDGRVFASGRAWGIRSSPACVVTSHSSAAVRRGAAVVRERTATLRRASPDVFLDRGLQVPRSGSGGAAGRRPPPAATWPIRYRLEPQLSSFRSSPKPRRSYSQLPPPWIRSVDLDPDPGSPGARTLEPCWTSAVPSLDRFRRPTANVWHPLPVQRAPTKLAVSSATRTRLARTRHRP